MHPRTPTTRPADAAARPTAPQASHRPRRLRATVATVAVALLSVGGLAACSGKSGQTLSTTTGGLRDSGSSGLTTGQSGPTIDTDMLSDDSYDVFSDDTGSIDSYDSLDGLDTDSGGPPSTYKGRYFSFEVPGGYTETAEDGYITAWTNASLGNEILVSSPKILAGIKDPAQAAAKLKASFTAEGYSTVEQDIESNLVYGTYEDRDFILSNPADGAGAAASIVVHGGTPLLVLALFDDYGDHVDVTGDLAHVANTWSWMN